MLPQGVDANIGYTDHKTQFVEVVLEKARARIARSTPVVLAAYAAAWPALFERERALIEAAAGDVAVGIEHVGSTSVPGLLAKPKIDIAFGVRTMAEGRAARQRLAGAGYIKDLDADAFDDWSVFSKPPGAGDHDIAHLHMVPFAGERWSRYLLFRDYLRAHPPEAAAYAALKRQLAEEFGADRLGYVEAKSDFVEEVTARATMTGA
jgi:GrpB-like predicted nucleotidyltransferase (UPF0157 family)